MTTARRDHTATLLPNGKVLVAGGLSGNQFLSSAELYDSATGTWSPTGSMRSPRRFHTATLLPNGKVLVAGGTDSNGISTNSAELYDPATQTWTPTGPPATGRFRHTATLLSNGKVLITGGFGNKRFERGVTRSSHWDMDDGRWPNAVRVLTRRPVA
jgi:N-acetylneuraminic acid mutarotase